MEDIFYAHIGGMDCFARALLTAQAILEDGEFTKLRATRYASFDNGKGKLFSQGKLGISDLHKLALQNGEPIVTSGRQEYFENLLNKFI